MANESKFGDFVWCAKTAQGLENFQVFQGVGAEHCTGELVAQLEVALQADLAHGQLVRSRWQFPLLVPLTSSPYWSPLLVPLQADW